MAIVYRGLDEVLGRTVAIKTMLPQYAGDESFAMRFKQEAQAAAALQSPYIVSVYDWGKDGDTYYIVMEYLRGTDLKSGIRRHGALDPRKVAQIGSQLFASAREYCIYSGRNVYTFTSILRVFFALAWVIGPPAALYTVGVYGFNFVYYANIAVYALVITAVVTLLPNTSQFRKEDAGEIKKIRLFSEPSVAFLCLTTVCVFVCNNMYLITMPQYVTKELDFPIRFVGIFVAAAAAMEMPIMVISSQLARRISMKYIILFGLGCGVVFGALVPVASTVGGFIAIQIVNALFIGIYTTLGMLYFQELMPKIPGQSTTLFTSSIAIGSIAAGGISGIIAESLGYVFVFYTNIIVSLLGFISMSLVRKI